MLENIEDSVFMQDDFPLGLFVQVGGTGHSVPNTLVTSEEIDSKMGFPCGYLSRASGVRPRYVCDQEDQVDMAVEACDGAACHGTVIPIWFDLASRMLTVSHCRTLDHIAMRQPMQLAGTVSWRWPRRGRCSVNVIYEFPAYTLATDCGRY